MIPVAKRIVLLSGPEDDCPCEPAMKFRLTYEGELKPTQRDPLYHEPDKLAQHKHGIRRHFHRQLRHLWATNKFLREHRVYPKDYGIGRPVAEKGAEWADDPSEKIPLCDAIANRYSKFGYNFVPLVRDDISLLCSLDVLFLRRDIPGSALQAGDLDNRIKTLIDTLRAPASPNELVGEDEKPRSDDTPMFCLLWDDKQVSHFSVETDTLLDEESKDDADKRKVRLVVTVELRPYNVSMFNLSFAGS